MVDFCTQDDVGDYNEVKWLKLLVIDAAIPHIYWCSEQISSSTSGSTYYYRSHVCDLAYWRLFCDDMTFQQSGGKD